MLILVVGGCAVWANATSDFYMGLDGKQSIRDNPHIRRLWPLSEALSMPKWPDVHDLELILAPSQPRDDDWWRNLQLEDLRAIRGVHNPMDDTPTIAMRPTFSLSLALTNVLLGHSPVAQHRVNVLIHILAALALFGLVRRTLQGPRFAALGAVHGDALAGVVALIWLVHPLQTESVTYVVQRAESLMGMFLLVAVYCAVRASDSPRQGAWQAAAVVACALGAGSKQTAVFASLLVALYDFVFGAPGRRWARPLLYALLAAPLFVVLISHGLVSSDGAMAARFDPVRYLSYALAQPAVVLHYLWLSVWPADLYLYVNTKTFAVGSLAGVVVPTVILVAVFVATGWAVYRRHWLGFVGAWFFVTLGPTSSFFDVSDLIQEHRMYVPLASPVVAAVVAAGALLARATAGWNARARAALALGAAALVVAALGVRTHVRNLDYLHEFRPLHPADVQGNYTILADYYLLDDELLQSEGERALAMLADPERDAHDEAFAHFVLALVASARQRHEESARHFERLLEAEPDYAYGYYQYGVERLEAGDYPGAIARLREALRLDPTLVYAGKDLARALEATGDAAGARQALLDVLRERPGFGLALFELGMQALEHGRTEEAREYFARAVRDRPEPAEPHFELGMLAWDDADYETAAAEFARATRIRPSWAEALKAQGMALARLDKLEQARDVLARAVTLDPDYVAARVELGIILRQLGDLEASAVQLDRALELDPESADVHFQRGRLAIEAGRTQMAEERFRAALARDPDHPAANHDLGGLLRSQGREDEAREFLSRAAR